MCEGRAPLNTCPAHTSPAIHLRMRIDESCQCGDSWCKRRDIKRSALTTLLARALTSTYSSQTASPIPCRYRYHRSARRSQVRSSKSTLDATISCIRRSPEALIRRSPSPSHPPTPPRHLPGLWSRSARRVASFDGPQGRWSKSHSMSDHSLP